MMMPSRDPAPGALLRIDEQLSLIEWPELKPSSEIALSYTDCIIIGAGFEDRAFAGFELAHKTSSNFHVALVRYLPKVEENQGRAYLSLCQQRGINVEEFVYDRENPSGIGSLLASHCAQFDRVFVDISGMSRLLIVQIFAALVGSNIQPRVLYAEAEVYPPIEKEYRAVEEKSPSFISSGIFEIVSTPELSSVAMLGGAIRLISFPSFDPAQLSNLVQEVQPTYNHVIHGLPPSDKLAWRTEAIKQLNKSTLMGLQRVENHETSTLDYRETLYLALDLYKRYSAFDRIVIAPTGSKMQTVAIGILRAHLSDIQIVYPTPLQFVNPSHYTEGVKQLFHFTVPIEVVQ